MSNAPANRPSKWLTKRSSQRLKGLISSAVSLAFVAALPVPVAAADITWGGGYRAEGVFIKNPELTDADSNKSYILHHLMLAPKIVAADGLTIFSRIDVLNNAGFGIGLDGTVFSVAGDVIGNGPGNSATAGGAAAAGDGIDSSNAWARTQRATPLHVTALYGSWVHEFGHLVVGRTPVQFGLGMVFNAGNGLFDHFISTKDLVGYKVVLGNLFLMPMLGKVNEGNLGEEDDINDLMVHAQYENPETDLVLGVFYQIRVGTHAGNDTPTTIEDGGASRVDGFRQTMIGGYTSQRVQNFRISVEGNMLSGETGMATAANQVIGLDAFGIAAEVAWTPADGKFTGLLKAGYATGDDPATANTYEGFIFNRNYDVGMLMFNHPLGEGNVLRTGLLRGDGAASPVRNQIDTEAVSNAFYLAPSVQYRSRDNLTWGGTFVYGILNATEAGGSSNLGFEIDLNVTYKPFERFTWVTEVGLLFPGEAWQAPQGGDNQFAYGLTTKAAISF
jgi:hypothetical protein